MSSLPETVVEAARVMGLSEVSLGPLGGATDRTWACGEHILRTGAPAQLRHEVLAMTAAGTVVPVPEVIDVAEFTDRGGHAQAAYLMTKLPGRRAGDIADLSTSTARAIGEQCGHLHAVVASVKPPAGLKTVALPGPGAPDDEEAHVGLLHLDLHPLNVLMNRRSEVSGVVDWANVASGPVVLDRARTWSIFTLDPAALRFHQHPQFQALMAGWSTAARWPELPAQARAWACEYMLGDLSTRYPGYRLEPVRRQLVIARHDS